MPKSFSAGARVSLRAIGAVLWAEAFLVGCSGRPPVPETLSPTAAPPVLQYESVFATYRRGAEAGPGSWRALNDEVGRLGGHMGQIGDMPAPNAAAGIGRAN